MLLHDIPLFADLTEADHNKLLQVAQHKTFPRFKLIVSEGDIGDRFYLLRKGRAKVYLGDDLGREVILSILEPGDFFCEMAMIDDEPCSANIMTIEESEFTSIGKEDFQQVMASSPDMAKSLLKTLAQRLRESNQQIESLALKDVQERVEHALQGLAKLEENELVVPAGITHRNIAAMVGASREMVTRVFRELEATGFVRIDGRRITLTKPADS